MAKTAVRNRFKKAVAKPAKKAAASFVVVSSPLYKQPVRAQDGSMAFCKDIREWQRLAAKPGVEGICVRRPLNPSRFQAAADALASQLQFAASPTGKIRIDVSREELCNSSATTADFFRGIAEKLMNFIDVPSDLHELIISDAGKMGEQLVELLPDTEWFGVALDLLGESVCRRWHVDNYVGRAIVSYNFCATEYADAGNVNMWELENCGNNDHIITDKTKTSQIEVGSILFMKGGLFQPGNPGLVHKAPAPAYDSQGTVINRLCLKVDAPEQ